MNSATTLVQQKYEKEKRQVWWRSFVLNFVFANYAFFCLVYLAQHNSSSPWPISNSSLALLSASLSLAISLLWTRSQGSTGRMLVERTHPMLKEHNKLSKRLWIRTPSGIFTLAMLALTLCLGWVVTEINFYSLFGEGGMDGAARIFNEILNPNWTILGSVLKAMLVTIFIAFVATATAIPIAFVLSFLCARNLMKTHPVTFAMYHVIRLSFNFVRSVEPFMWAIIFSVWVGIGPFAGMLALMLHSIASLSKLYSEAIESIDRGPIEAIEATGANFIQTVWYAIVPQVIIPFLSFTIYRWDINIRMATVIGLVGGGGVGTMLMQYQGLAKWHEVGTIVLVIAAVVWFMDYMSARIREAIT